MNITIKPVSIEDFVEFKCTEGYKWLSDQPKPEVVTGKITKSDLKELPFIVEGLFWDDGSKESLLIRNLDGKYSIYKYDLSNLSTDDWEDTTLFNKHLAHRLGEHIRKIRFLKYSEMEDDLFLPGELKTLVFKGLIFVGFEK